MGTPTKPGEAYRYSAELTAYPIRLEEAPTGTFLGLRNCYSQCPDIQRLGSMEFFSDEKKNDSSTRVLLKKTGVTSHLFGSSDPGDFSWCFKLRYLQHFDILDPSANDR